MKRADEKRASVIAHLPCGPRLRGGGRRPEPRPPRWIWDESQAPRARVSRPCAGPAVRGRDHAPRQRAGRDGD